MLSLNDALWSSLSPGPHAASFPAELRRLREVVAAGKYTRRAIGDLCLICNQWSTYDSTLAVAPHLVQICREEPPQSTARIDLLSWIGWCVACVHLNGTDGPAPLKRWYDDAIPFTRDLIAASLPFVQEVEHGPGGLRELLGAFAACHGNLALAFILYELEAGGFRCDHCKSFILPLQSSMNPLWIENRG